MLNTWNFQCWKTKDSAWLPYKFHYWTFNSFDPVAKVYVISEQPLYTCFELCLSFRVGRHIVFVFTVFISPYGCLSVTKSCPLYSLKPFKVFLWHLIQTQSITKWTANRKTHISSSYIFGVTSFQRCEWHFLVTASYSLYNLKTLKDIFMKLSSNINHHHITYRAQHMIICCLSFFLSFFLSFKQYIYNNRMIAIW